MPLTTTETTFVRMVLSECDPRALEACAVEELSIVGCPGPSCLVPILALASLEKLSLCSTRPVVNVTAFTSFRGSVCWT
ncbi:hypothetical protein ERJ75_000412400 [Trypanosoma vivax]|nr:hypothetical protein ERJ75_000412400 [Trypanosoma vivax]